MSAASEYDERDRENQDEQQRYNAQQPTALPSPQTSSGPKAYDRFKADLFKGMRGINTGRHGARYLGGPLAGQAANPGAMDAYAMERWNAMGDDQKATWDSQNLLSPSERATQTPVLKTAPAAPGSPVSPPQAQAAPVLQLPANFRNGGFNDFSPGSGFGPGLNGRILPFGPGPSAASRLETMNQQHTARALAATGAVAAHKAEQVAHPAATVDRAIATRDAQLAQSGITDMGGGHRVLNNQYGTGHASPTAPAGQVGAGPGQVPRDQVGAHIQQQVAASTPGAGARREGDRQTEISSWVGRQPVMPKHLISGTPAVRPFPFGPPMAKAAGFVDDRPSVASTTARAGMMQPRTVVGKALAALPKAFQPPGFQPSAAKMPFPPMPLPPGKSAPSSQLARR